MTGQANLRLGIPLPSQKVNGKNQTSRRFLVFHCRSRDQLGLIESALPSLAFVQRHRNHQDRIPIKLARNL